MERLRVAVVGASGYAGAEAVRWILRHPRLSLGPIVARREAGQPLAHLYPQVPAALRLESATAESLAGQVDAVILAMPAGEALDWVGPLRSAGRAVYDLGPDFRLTDPEVYRRHYGRAHTAPEMLSRAAYGLVELFAADIRARDLIALPGCFPTAACLAVAPLFEAGLADPQGPVVVQAVSGLSGAGRGLRADLMFGAAHDEVRAYGVGGAHRHRPEIQQVLARLGGQPVEVLFTPHTAPLFRGLLATCHVPLRAPCTSAELLERYRERYRASPLVTVTEEPPGTRATLGSARCAVTVRAEPSGRFATAVASIDNLGKGAAAQAIQALNLKQGWPETTGLEGGLWP